MENSKLATNLNEDDEAWLYGGANEDSNDNNNEQNLNDNTNSNQDFIDYNDNDVNYNNRINGNQPDNINEEDEEITNITSKVSSLDTNQQINQNGIVDNENDKNDENYKSGSNDDDNDDDDEDDDDDDDDNIKIVIGEISKKPFTAPSPTRQLSKTNQIATTNLSTQIAKPQPTKGVDLDAQGTINDVPTLEYDLQGIKDEDKPWRKPGADITDYFNYGFNEETWIAYCMKQRRLRAENAANKLNPALVNIQGGPGIAIQPILTPLNIPNNPNTNNIMLNQQNAVGILQNQNQNFMQKQTGFPRPILAQPQRKMGQIDVIGSTDSTSRRPAYELDMNMQNHQISVLGNNNFQPHVQLPDLSAPPPNWMTGPGPQMPPGSGLMRMPHGPMQRMGHPMQMNYPPYHFGPQGMQPVERPQNYGFMPPYVRNQVPQNNPTWEKPQTLDTFYPEGSSPRSRTRSPTPGKSTNSRSKSPSADKYKEEQIKYKHRDHISRGGGEYERDHRRSPSPRRSSYRSHRDRDRERDYDRRDDQRDKRNEQREKSRSRERTRSRSRDRDEKYKRSRRKSDTDDDHRSSRSHKRSKKSRKGRDSNDRDRDNSSSHSKLAAENQIENISSDNNKNKLTSSNSTSDVTNKND